MLPGAWGLKEPSLVLTCVPWPLGQPQYLLFLTKAGWDDMKARAKATPEARKRAAVERQLSSTSAELSPDKLGRLVLPDVSRKLGIDKEAEIVGRLDRFEIWGPTTYDQLDIADQQLAAEVTRDWAV